jgi:hypothetical protein
MVMCLQKQWQAGHYRDNQDTSRWNGVSPNQAEKKNKEHMVKSNRYKHTDRLSKRSKQHTAEGECSTYARQLGESLVVSHISGVEAHHIASPQKDLRQHQRAITASHYS